MCGIVGYATGHNRWTHEKFFRQALLVDMLRGFDSTGVIVGNDYKVDYFKKAVCAMDFLDMKPADKLINSLPLNRPAFMIGHNRAATIGDVTSANAHPFHQGDLIGVHNGTLRTYTRLERSQDFGTDSECLYFNLSRRAPVDVLSDVKGAYALVWYNEAEKTVNIIRNDERPLYIAKLKDEDTIMWASEVGMLRWIANRTDNKVDSIIQPKENYHIKIHMNHREKGVSEFEMFKLDVVDNYPVYNYGGNNSKKGQSNSGKSSGGGKSTSGKTASGGQLTPEEVIKQFDLSLTGEEYPVWIDSWTQYPTTPSYGSMTGYLMVEPWLEVEFKAVPKAEFKKYERQTVQVSLREIIVRDRNPWHAKAVAGASSLKLPPAGEWAGAEVFQGPTGEKISKAKMLELTSAGCYLCSAGIGVAEFDFIDWLDDKPVCPDCVHRDPGQLEA